MQVGVFAGTLVNLDNQPPAHPAHIPQALTDALFYEAFRPSRLLDGVGSERLNQAPPCHGGPRRPRPQSSAARDTNGLVSPPVETDAAWSCRRPRCRRGNSAVRPSPRRTRANGSARSTLDATGRPPSSSSSCSTRPSAPTPPGRRGRGSAPASWTRPTPRERSRRSRLIVEMPEERSPRGRSGERAPVREAVPASPGCRIRRRPGPAGAARSSIRSASPPAPRAPRPKVRASRRSRPSARSC
jgi:hypothetical protein